jgi:hypothetical protein
MFVCEPALESGLRVIELLRERRESVDPRHQRGVVLVSDNIQCLHGEVSFEGRSPRQPCLVETPGW